MHILLRRGYSNYKNGKRLLTDLVSFLEKNYDLTAYKKVNVTLYGGEPLMYPHLTKEIMETLNLFFDRCEVTSDYRMITNGTPLNAQIAQDLVERGLRLIQVTIDGPQRYHDARRFYPDGAGSFETIIKNLQQYIDIIPYVALRISLDKQNCNFKEMDQFLVRLNELDLKDKLSELYFACIVETLGENQHGSSYAFDYAEAGKILCTFSELLKRHGICSLEDPNFSPCRAHSNGGVVINADGELYKCISLIGRKEYSVGHISTGFNENYIPFLNINKWRSCLKENCPFVPLCAGGCHFDSVVGYGDINLKACRKGMVEPFWLDSIVSNIFSESE